MDWRESVVSEELDPRGKSINEIMRWYYTDSLIVNRKYQRKLVWTLKEKQLFIDSIINKYPTPSIILSAYEGEDESHQVKVFYEIIDGLQRLNAIVSFVNNDYGIDWNGEECYYDTQYTPTALTRRNNNELHQHANVLPAEICQDFADFEMPIILTTQRVDREKKIEQIFSRINSSGRKLSAHDLRQASSIGEFPDLVRRVATNLRCDYTYYDEVNLADMPKISLRSEGLDYAIDPDDTFWRRHDIISFPNFRQSKDEEVIASALALILMGSDFRINENSLNSLYRPNTKNSDLITSKINNIGKDVIEGYAVEVINQIDNIFNSVDSNFTDYLYPKKNSRGKDISFIILFQTLYRLNRESYQIEDYEQVAKKLRSQFSSTFGIISNNSDYSKRITVMETTYNLLKSVMVKKKDRQKNDDDALLEKLLSLSPIEIQMVDFKIGITDFKSGRINKREVEKIWCTLVAMANTDSKYQKEGYVIIGIANDAKSYKNWKEIYGEPSVKYGKHYVVGITKEATTYFHNEDTYEQRFTDLIKNSKISEPLKSYVLSNYRLVEFNEKTLLLLPAVKQETESYYDNKFYVREGTKTVLKEEKDKVCDQFSKLSIF